MKENRVYQRLKVFLLAGVIASLQPLSANAHFLWLVQTGDSAEKQLHVYFGELAEPDDPALLDRVVSAKVSQIGPDGEVKPLHVTKGTESLEATISRDAGASIFVLTHDLGVISRGDNTFLLRYYAKTGPALDHPAWTSIDCGKQLALDVIPRKVGNKIQVEVKWNGEPVSGAQVTAQGPGIDDFEAESDDRGRALFAIGDEGAYSIRVRHIEAASGKSGQDTYDSIRHYTTLALNVGQATAAPTPAKKLAVTNNYPSIPENVTSFGAAVANGSLFVYGGHTGDAHSYAAEAQANTLYRLDLSNPKAWESWGEGPGLQGLAMVAHGGKLYRIGGFTAKNAEGETHDLWSRADVASFDIATRQWTDLSPLPEPRSSFDAAVMGDTIYVVGGWKIAGEEDNVWHKSAYELNLSDANPQWKALPEPPFQRRALSVAAHDGKIYAIGGMQQQGGPTTRVDLFDPTSGKWSIGPSLNGEGMDGFGSSAFATGGRLYVTTYSGKLQRLSEDGKSWQVVGELQRARFFHRLLPLSENQLVSIGGASMKVGKFEEVDVINVDSAN
ncbi:MAG: DUF4198 domain-containing protein [Pirellulaceae bacterium]